MEEDKQAVAEDSLEPAEDSREGNPVAVEEGSQAAVADNSLAEGDTPAAEEDNLEPEEDSQEDNPVAVEGNQAVEGDNNQAVEEGSPAAGEDNTQAVEAGRRQQACRIWDNKWPPGLTGWHNLDTLKLVVCRTHYKTVDRGRCWHRTWDI